MKYLAVVLGLFLMVGCCGTSKCSLTGGYRDYPYTDASGKVKIHRVYSNGDQLWLDQAEAAAK